MSPAVSLRKVSKKYPIYGSLGDRLRDALTPFRRHHHQEFWALRDINLEIREGSTLGVLGLNGSGKSTLLQIISSVLQPSSGTVSVDGRVAALIELGAGFDPEQSGRANAEFNCMLMGLRPAEIRQALPVIERFADIGDFFERPVKTYSSGMFMRVAFATAVHVDPDILVIDEALAVGDARFQQKCFRKFREFQSAGKTVIFVTHDRFSVPRLCNVAIILHQGRIIADGEPSEVVERYSQILALDSGNERGESTSQLALGAKPSIARKILPPTDGGEDRCSANPTYNKNEYRYGKGGAAIIDFVIDAENKTNPIEVKSGSMVGLSIRVRFDRHVETPIIGFSIKSGDGVLVFTTNSKWLGQYLRSQRAGVIAEYRFSFPADLASADWFIDLAIAAAETEMLDVRENVAHFRTNTAIPSIGFAALATRLEQL